MNSLPMAEHRQPAVPTSTSTVKQVQVPNHQTAAAEQKVGWDFSNLCLAERIRDEQQRGSSISCMPKKRLDHQEVQLKGEQQESSLYPSVQELNEASRDLDLSVEQVFAQAEQYKQHHPGSKDTTSSSDRPGAYHVTEPQHNEKPQLPSWVEVSHHVREKVERQSFLSQVEQGMCTSMHHTRTTGRDHLLEHSPSGAGTGIDEGFRKPTPSSHAALGYYCEDHSVTEATPSCSPPLTSSYEYSNRTQQQQQQQAPPPPRQQQQHQQSRRSPQHHQVQVEVAPGEYMRLRGSDETLHAIEMGFSTTVICFCCRIQLRCVPDCALVICPDCRVLSPVELVVADQEDRKIMAVGYDDDDDDDGPGGGVGLGLRVG